MKQLKKPILFTLIILPVAVVATVLACLYQFDLYPAEIMEEAIAEVGSRELVILISVVQSLWMIMLSSFFGYLLAEKTGLMKPWKIQKRPLLVTLAVSIAMGVLFSLDYWTFGALIPEIQTANEATMTLYAVLASILYGGVVEEILLRLLFLTLVAWILWKLFFRRSEKIPDGVIWAANLFAALAFAAGHLPTTVMTFGELTPLIVFRCFLFNGGFGFAFGWIYCKYGLSYSMISHAVTHIVCKLIWFIFL